MASPGLYIAANLHTAEHLPAYTSLNQLQILQNPFMMTSAGPDIQGEILRLDKLIKAATELFWTKETFRERNGKDAPYCIAHASHEAIEAHVRTVIIAGNLCAEIHNNRQFKFKDVPLEEVVDATDVLEYLKFIVHRAVWQLMLTDQKVAREEQRRYSAHYG